MLNSTLEISQLIVLSLSLPIYYIYKKIGLIRFKKQVNEKYLSIEVINTVNVNHQKVIFVNKKYVFDGVKAIYLFQTIGYDYNMAEREIIWHNKRNTVLAYNEYNFNECSYALVNVDCDYRQMTVNDIFILEERFNGLIYVVTRDENNLALMNIIFPKYDQKNFDKAIILEAEISHFKFKGKVTAFIEKKKYV